MSDLYPKSDGPAREVEDWAEQQARHAVLKIVVIVLGVIMAVMAVVVLSTLALRLIPPRDSSPQTGLAPAARAILPAGARLVSSSVGDGRVVIIYEAEGRAAALVLDARTLAILGRIEAAP